MASLKEIRARIGSITSTQKITSAMKMVSAAKLKKTEGTVKRFLPFKDKLSEALTNYVASLEESIAMPLAEQRKPKRVAVVAFSSNSGLCGVFNTNIVKLFNTTYNKYVEEVGAENIVVYTIGSKIHDNLKKRGIAIRQSFDELSEKPTYEAACQISDMLVDMFLKNEVDRVELLYNHFKNTGVQVPQAATFLPIEPAAATDTNAGTLYIVEPDKETFVNSLVPKVLRTTMYATMLDSLCAEYGARTTAMTIASDNAESLLQDLKVQYNKARQEVITNELIDIVGGTEALNK